MKGILDLMTLVFLGRYIDRPLHLFGFGGIMLFMTGFCLDSFLVLRGLLVTGKIGHQAALLLGVFIMIVGIQFVSIGLLGELLINRLGPGNKDYNIEEIS
jgi:hypothetical protein